MRATEALSRLVTALGAVTRAAILGKKAMP
jgi:hypothetical protein